MAHKCHKQSTRKPRSELTRIIGLNIAKQRMAKKMTQKEFAKKLGVSGSNIDRIEHGTVNIPIIKLNEIAKTLGVSIEDLYEEIDE